MDDTIVYVFNAMVLTGLGMVPAASTACSMVGNCVLPLSVPLLLFGSSVEGVCGSDNGSFILFRVTKLNAFVKTVVAKFLFVGVSGVGNIITVSINTRINNAMGLVTVTGAFGISPGFAGTTTVTTGFLMVMLVLVLARISKVGFFESGFPRPCVSSISGGVASGDGSLTSRC